MYRKHLLLLSQESRQRSWEESSPTVKEGMTPPNAILTKELKTLNQRQASTEPHPHKILQDARSAATKASTPQMLGGFRFLAKPQGGAEYSYTRLASTYKAKERRLGPSLSDANTEPEVPGPTGLAPSSALCGGGGRLRLEPPEVPSSEEREAQASRIKGALAERYSRAVVVVDGEGDGACRVGLDREQIDNAEGNMAQWTEAQRYLDRHYTETKQEHPWLDRDLTEPANVAAAHAKCIARNRIAHGYRNSEERLEARLRLLDEHIETALRIGPSVAEEDEKAVRDLTPTLSESLTLTLIEKAMKDRAVSRALATIRSAHPGVTPHEERRVAGVTAWSFLVHRGLSRVPKVPPSEFEPEASKSVTQVLSKLGAGPAERAAIMGLAVGAYKAWESREADSAALLKEERASLGWEIPVEYKSPNPFVEIVTGTREARQLAIDRLVSLLPASSGDPRGLVEWVGLLGTGIGILGGYLREEAAKGGTGISGQGAAREAMAEARKALGMGPTGTEEEGPGEVPAASKGGEEGYESSEFESDSEPSETVRIPCPPRPAGREASSTEYCTEAPTKQALVQLAAGFAAGSHRLTTGGFYHDAAEASFVAARGAGATLEWAKEVAVLQTGAAVRDHGGTLAESGREAGDTWLRLSLAPFISTDETTADVQATLEQEIERDAMGVANAAKRVGVSTAEAALLAGLTAGRIALRAGLGPEGCSGAAAEATGLFWSQQQQEAEPTSALVPLVAEAAGRAAGEAVVHAGGSGPEAAAVALGAAEGECGSRELCLLTAGSVAGRTVLEQGGSFQDAAAAAASVVIRSGASRELGIMSAVDIAAHGVLGISKNSDGALPNTMAADAARVAARLAGANEEEAAEAAGYVAGRTIEQRGKGREEAAQAAVEAAGAAGGSKMAAVRAAARAVAGVVRREGGTLEEVVHAVYGTAAKVGAGREDALGVVGRVVSRHALYGGASPYEGAHAAREAIAGIPGTTMVQAVEVAIREAGAATIRLGGTAVEAATVAAAIARESGKNESEAIEAALKVAAAGVLSQGGSRIEGNVAAAQAAAALGLDQKGATKVLVAHGVPMVQAVLCAEAAEAEKGEKDKAAALVGGSSHPAAAGAAAGIFLEKEYRNVPVSDRDLLRLYRFFNPRGKAKLSAADILAVMRLVDPDCTPSQAEACVVEADSKQAHGLVWRDFEKHIGILEGDIQLEEPRILYRLVSFLRMVLEATGSAPALKLTLHAKCLVSKKRVRKLYQKCFPRAQLQELLQTRSLADVSAARRIELTDAENLSYESFVALDEALCNEKQKRFSRLSPLLLKKKATIQRKSDEAKREASRRRQRVVWHAMQACFYYIGRVRVRQKAIATVQRYARGLKSRTRVRALRQAIWEALCLRMAVKVQRTTRMVLARFAHKRLRETTFVVARYWRTYARRKRLRHAVMAQVGLIRAASQLQRCYRGHGVRKVLARLRRKATVIQCGWRQKLARAIMKRKHALWLKQRERERQEAIRVWRRHRAAKLIQAQARLMILWRHQRRARKRWRKVKRNIRYLLTEYTEYLTGQMSVEESKRVMSMESLWIEAEYPEYERIQWLRSYNDHSDPMRKLYVMYSTLGITKPERSFKYDRVQFSRMLKEAGISGLVKISQVDDIFLCANRNQYRKMLTAGQLQPGRGVVGLMRAMQTDEIQDEEDGDEDSVLEFDELIEASKYIDHIHTYHIPVWCVCVCVCVCV